MLVACLLLHVALGQAPAASAPRARGTLVVDGGGRPSVDVRKRALELAGGPGARVLVIPQASTSRNAGNYAASKWREVGAERVSILDLEDRKAAVAAVRRADLIWMGGGDQARLMRVLEKTGVPEVIRERYEAGAVVGGTSAGASVMSRIMIARSRREAPREGCEEPILGEGLGLWPGVIVDQHFHRTGRRERLARAVAEAKGAPIGVGIDESTAAIVSGRTLEVVGRGRVVILTSGRARPRTLDPGMKYDLDPGIIAGQVAVEK